ncbi:MAG: RNHCP domain-containing protein [Patescibacteria group bacterium]|jgi:rubredoxin
MLKLTKKFTRCPEDFVCRNCGQAVVGNGYTNHCPACLYSQHVDNQPGDRQNHCRGLMAPIAVAPKGDSYIITHQCQKCGAVKNNKSAAGDSFEVILRVMADRTKKE